MGKNRDENGRFMKGHEHRFTTEKQPSTNGRPKRLVGAVISELKGNGYARVTSAEVKEAFEYLIGMDLEGITELHNSQGVPMLFKSCIKQILKEGKSFEVIERMLDRAHGKATQPIDGEIKRQTVISVRTEELDDFLENLKAKENEHT